MKRLKVIWNWFSIQHDELTYVVPLLLLYFLSGAFCTVGQIYCETLFLKTYGAEGFSHFFMYNGIALIVCGILYNYLLLKLSLRKGYLIIIITSVFLIFCTVLFGKSQYQWFPFMLYMGNYLFTFFLDIHFFNYSFQFLNIRNSKRILPFVMGGGKLGGIITSIVIFSILGGNINRYGIYIWMVLGLVLLVPIFLLNRLSLSDNAMARVKKKDILPDYKMIERTLRKMKLSYSSSIFAFSVLAVFSMSIVNQISEYYFALTFNSFFATRDGLASFLSLYTFGADFLTLLAQIFLTSKIIKNIGVTRSNYLYPGTFVVSLLVLILFPGLLAGILLRFYRKNFSLIIRTPVYNIIMAASPRDRMAEVKSFISGIIAPLGMVIGGAAILLIYSYLTPEQGYAFASVCALFYFAMIKLQNRAYVNTIRNRLRYDYSGRYTHKINYDDYEDFFTDRITKKSYISVLEDIFNDSFSMEAVHVLYKNFVILDELTKVNILKVIKNEIVEFKREVVIHGLGDSSPFVRAYALYLLRDFKLSDRKDLLMEYYWHGKLDSERYVISYLLNLETDKKKEQENVEFIKNSINMIKQKIINEELQTIEFVVFVNALPSHFFLDALIDLALEKRSHLLFQNLVPYVGKIDVKTARMIADRFAHCGLDINLYVTFIANIRGLRFDDKLVFLENLQNVPVDKMESLFRYDYSSELVAVLFERLMSDRSYNNKDNYLKCLMTLSVKPQHQLNRFIAYELEVMITLTGYRSALDQGCQLYYCDTSNLLRFLMIITSDMIEFHKHLVLKAISIITGVNIDDVYESNILLKDSELNSLILEYIESSGKKMKQVVPFIEGSISSVDYQYIGTIENFTQMLNDLVREVNILLPDVRLSGNFYIKSTISGGTAENYLTFRYTNGEDTMLTLLEKVIFLKDTQLFSGLKTNELIHIAEITKEIEVEQGQYIIKNGESGDELFIVVEGEVNILYDEEVITTVNVGNCIGELSVIDNEPRSADAKTVKKSRFLVLRRKDFLLTLKDQPAILINIMKIITGRLRSSLVKI